MSFYLGASNNGNNILHITKNRDSLVNMQNGITDNSVYHSDMVFIDYEEFEIQEVITSRYFCQTSRIIPPNVPVHKIPYTSLPSYAVTLLREGNLFMLVDNNYTQVGRAAGKVFSKGWYGCISNYNLDMVFYTSTGCGEERFTYDNPNTNALGITGQFDTLPTKILIFNVKHNGTFTDLYPSTSNEIKLSRSEMSVNGVDLSSLRYLQNKEYPGSTPLTTANAGTLYKVSPPTVGDFYLNVTDSGTTIRRGSYTIIDSNNPPVSNHLSTIVKHSINVDTGDNYTLTNLINLGDVSQYLNKLVLIGINCLQTYKYPNGTILETKSLNTTSVTSFKNNEVIAMIGYNFAFGIYYNATAFYGSFNQLVLRISNGTLFIAGKTSRYAYKNSDVSFSGNYAGPKEDLTIAGDLTLCIL